MKKSIVTFIAAIGAITAFAGASKGNCQGKAVALKGSQQVKLVDEWDSEFKEYYESGAYYYKVTLPKGSDATIALQGGSTIDMDLDVYTDWDSDYYTEFELGETASK